MSMQECKSKIMVPITIKQRLYAKQIDINVSDRLCEFLCNCVLFASKKDRCYHIIHVSMCVYMHAH